MTRDELAAQVASYMHRDDLTQEIPGFIELATDRIGRDLRSRENQAILDPFEPAQALDELPEDFRAMRELTFVVGNRRCKVSSAAAGTIAAVSISGSRPIFYRILGKSIEIQPYQALEYRLVYFNAPAALETGDSTNAVLDNYPAIYLYASLIEAFFFTQDAGGRDLSLATYSGEVEIENARSAKSDGGDTPTMRGYLQRTTRGA